MRKPTIISFFEILLGDLSEATTATEKDKLTFGVFSKLSEDAAFRKEVEDYAASAHEKIEVPSADTDVEPSTARVWLWDDLAFSSLLAP